MCCDANAGPDYNPIRQRAIRMAGIGRLIGAVLGSSIIFALYAFALPLGVMAIALYVARLFPMTGRWRKDERRRRVASRHEPR